MKVADVIKAWEDKFAQYNVDCPRLSAQILLSHILKIPRLELLLDSNKLIDEIDYDLFHALAIRRCLGEPVAYLIENKEFYGMSFYVTPDVLIPRPETELILDHLPSVVPLDQNLNVIDIGTGSGALAIGFVSLFPYARVLGIDISSRALRVARYNATQLGYTARVRFAQGDLVSGVDVGLVDIILANLPYVPESTRAELSSEVLNYEPHSALFAGLDGLACYQRLAVMLTGSVRSGSRLVCEIHHDQAEAMSAMFAPISTSVKVIKDFSGFDRIMSVVF